MAPRQLSKRRLDNLKVRPRRRERAHAHEVRTREASHPGEFVQKVFGQLRHDLRASPTLPLSLENLASDGPVEPNQLDVDRCGGPHLGLVNALLQVALPGRVLVRRNRLRRLGNFVHAPIFAERSQPVTLAEVLAAPYFSQNLCTARIRRLASVVT